MGRYVISDHLNVAARGEFLASTTSTAAAADTVKQGEGTVMLGIDVGKNFELRPEVRADFAGKVDGADILEGGAKSDASHRRARRAHLVLAAASPVKT